MELRFRFAFYRFKVQWKGAKIKNKLVLGIPDEHNLPE